MDNLFPLYVAAAALVTAFIWLRFGDKIGTFAGALLAAGLLWLKLRKDVKNEVENDQLRERVRNDQERNEARERADEAADRVRVDNATGGLRDDDGFRRD